MTFATLLTRAWLLANDDLVPPTSGTMDYDMVLNIANIYIDRWQNEPGVNWASLYARTNLSATVTATDTFALPGSLRKLSQRKCDYVVITRLVGMSRSPSASAS